MAIDVLVENDKKMKKTGLWDCGVATGGPGQKPDRKKMTRSVRKKMTQSVRQRYGLWRVDDVNTHPA